MTLDGELRPPRARTHAFVIGVGDYHHLEGWKDNPGLRPLSSSRPSAWEFVECLERLQNPRAPLGTIEVLVSGSPPPGQARAHAAPTLENVTRAFDRWLAECNTDPDNVAIFYFCGHGLEREHLALLLEDLARSPNRPFECAIDFHATYRGMAMCRARTQCFFIDACRAVPEEVLRNPDFGGVTLVEGRLGKVTPRTASIVYAAGHGALAFGREGRVSRFTAALVEAFERSGAERRPGGRWAVTTASVGRGVQHVLDRSNRGLGPDQHQYAVLAGEHAAEDALHVLPHVPRVTVTLQCESPNVTSRASFSIERRRRPVDRRESGNPSPWVTEVDAGIYDLTATFSDVPSRVIEDEVVDPPARDVTLEPTRA